MEYEGDISIFREIKDHACSVAENRESTSKPWLCIGPGTMRGAFGGGQVSALEERGLTDGFAGVFGNSTGAPTAAYFLAGQARKGTTIYHEECTWEEFISLKRYLRGGNAADINFLARVVRGEVSSKRLDEAVIRTRTRTELLMGVTVHGTGESRVVDAKALLPDIVQGIVASAAIPGLFTDTVMIDGARVVDGGFSNPLCMDEILRRGATSVLVFANRKREYQETAVKRLMTRFTMRNESDVLRRLSRMREVPFNREFTLLRGSGIPYLIIWCDDGIGALTTDQKRLVQASERARMHLHQLMDRAEV